MEIVAQLAIGRLRQYERHRNRAILGAGKEPILHSYSTSYDLHHKAITRLLTKSDAAGNDPLPSKANYTVYRSARTSLWKDVDNLI
uniref:Acyl-CoA_dh_2 domain-containing protein n=1 Tax=Heterorhabditis bacteriophora TaxID=37862 RepID=A0A1I7X7Z6_HETBA